jgi:hypothetical protein
MDARDVIVSWLELDDNFLRVTAPPLSPSTRRDRANLHAESAALDELAAFVNQRLRLSWDGQHARHMLRHYLAEYRSTAEAAASADFSLGDFPTKQLKLAAMCRNFQRLQALHRKEKEVREQQVTTYVKLPIHLTEAERLAREKEVVPESDLSHSCENSETDRKDERQPQPSSESTISERDEVVTLMLSGGGEEQESKDAPTGARGRHVETEEKQEGKREDNDEEAGSNQGLLRTRGTMKVAGRSGKKVAVKNMKSKKQQKDRVERASSSRADGDDGAREGSPARRSTRAKRRAVWLVDTTTNRSPSREEDDLTLRKKMRSAKTRQVDGSDVIPTQTTQTASSSSSEEPRKSPVDAESTPSIDTRSHGKAASSTQSASGLDVSSASAPTQPPGSMPSPSGVRPPKSVNPSSSAAHDGRISTATTAASQGSSRLAMAEFMSQRQQLLSRVADPDSQDNLEKRQRSLSESDYGLSDLDLPSVDPTPSVSRNPTPSETPRGARCESGPPPGLLPPLIDGARTIDGKSNLERKRVFFRAKQLAFEQLKWHRENERQQSELELLHREIKTREALAKQELAIRRMRVRADIIQPMISAGASVADIAERLKLL